MSSAGGDYGVAAYDSTHRAGWLLQRVDRRGRHGLVCLVREPTIALRQTMADTIAWWERQGQRAAA